MIQRWNKQNKNNNNFEHCIYLCSDLLRISGMVFDETQFDDIKCLHQPVLNAFACCSENRKRHKWNNTKHHIEMGTYEIVQRIFCRNKSSSVDQNVDSKTVLWRSCFVSPCSGLFVNSEIRLETSELSIPFAHRIKELYIYLGQ